MLFKTAKEMFEAEERTVTREALSWVFYGFLAFVVVYFAHQVFA
jgi:hypothetical protein